MLFPFQCMPFIYFSYLTLILHLFLFIALAKTSSKRLNKSGEREHPCLVLDLRGKAFSLSPLTMMLAVALSYMAFSMLRYVHSILILLRLFIINGYWILSNAFSASIEMIWFLSFILLIWYIMLIDLWMSNHPCIQGIKLTWSWCMCLLMYCCIWFANILLTICF